jgi:2,3-bisphosphoglycerate-dependent phosphoglycerate mutase
MTNMEKLTLTLLLIIFSGAQLFCQEKTVTTFILMRHAERANDGTSDPDISAAGQDRAKKIATLLKDTKVDAIYSTNYKRTRNTITPLAEAKGLQVQFYEPLKGEVLDDLLKKHQGGTIVVIGHSNTTPWVANYLVGREEYKNFSDDDYDNLIVVSVADKGNASVTWLNY